MLDISTCSHLRNAQSYLTLKIPSHCSNYRSNVMWTLSIQRTLHGTAMFAELKLIYIKRVSVQLTKISGTGLSALKLLPKFSYLGLRSLRNNLVKVTFSRRNIYHHPLVGQVRTTISHILALSSICNLGTYSKSRTCRTKIRPLSIGLLDIMTKYYWRIERILVWPTWGFFKPWENESWWQGKLYCKWIWAWTLTTKLYI